MVARELEDARRLELHTEIAATSPSAHGRHCYHQIADLAYVIRTDGPLRELLIDVAHPLLNPGVAELRLTDNRRERAFKLDGGIEILGQYRKSRDLPRSKARTSHGL